MGSLAAALVAAQADMPAVEKNATNPHFGSRFISLDHLIAKTKPVLTKHGLAIVQFPATTDQGTPALTTTLIHAESGEQLSGTVPLVLAKQDMQGLGAALTYARRYGWASALAISDEDDDDGNAASAPPQEALPKKTSQPVGGQKGAGAASSPAPTNTVQAKDGEFAGPVIEHTIGNGYGLAGEIDASPAGGEKYKGKQVRDLTSGQLSWIAGTWAPEGKEPWRPKNPTQQLVQRAVIAYQGDPNATILLAEPEGGGFTGDEDIPFAPTIDGLGG